MIEKSNSTSLALATIAILGQPPRRDSTAIEKYQANGTSAITLVIAQENTCE